jgi:hypothetical protein
MEHEMKRNAERWIVGSLVTVTVEGSPLQGVILAAPFGHDDGWTMDETCRHDAWIVDFFEFGNYEVVAGKAIRYVPASAVREAHEPRRALGAL